MNNDYYELIEYWEDEGGMICLGRKIKLFWCNCAFVSTYMGCRLVGGSDGVHEADI